MLARLAPTRAVLPARCPRSSIRAPAPPPKPAARRLRSRAVDAPPRAVGDRRGGEERDAMSRGWRTPAMAVFWDLDNLRPPSGYETLWAYRLVEAAFEFADLVHGRAYARKAPWTPRRRRR